MPEDISNPSPPAQLGERRCFPLAYAAPVPARRHSRSAIASLLSGTVALFAFGLAFLGRIDVTKGGIPFTTMIVMLAATLAATTGASFGVLGLFNRECKRVLAVIGLVFSALAFCGCLMIVWALSLLK